MENPNTVPLTPLAGDSDSGLISVEKLIHVIRGQQVMMDSDLARLYGVETRRLNEQVKRNIDRFPEDFMFQLTRQEAENLMSQIATSNSRSQFATLNIGAAGIATSNFILRGGFLPSSRRGLL